MNEIKRLLNNSNLEFNVRTDKNGNVLAITSKTSKYWIIISRTTVSKYKNVSINFSNWDTEETATAKDLKVSEALHILQFKLRA